MFGELIKELRTKKGISIRELYEMSGVSESSLYGYEKKGQAPRTTGRILKLSEVLEVDKEILLAAACADDDKRGKLKWD